MSKETMEPLERHDHIGTCWWCGGAAGSREHRYKASDLRREFSREEYEKGEVIMRRGEVTEVIRGPKAATVKFADVFCARCNNERSQPFDLAYDRLVGWWAENEATVESTRRVPLEEIDSDWEGLVENVCRYFVKHIGCRIADCGFAVPDSFRAYLDGREFPSGLVLSFELDAVFGAVNWILKQEPTPQGTSGNLFLGPISGEVTPEGHDAVLLRGHWVYHALQLVWEWRQEGEPSGTNLDRPLVELPLVRGEEVAALRRLARRRGAPGMAGVLWRVWYRVQLALRRGGLLGGAEEAPEYLDLTKENSAEEVAK